MNRTNRTPSNKGRFITSASCLVLIALSQTALAQSDKAKKIEALMKPFVQANQFSGVVLAAEDGKVIYEKAFGLANADYKIPNQVNTRIGIASITKLFTSVILTRLVEQQKIALADKLTKYIPDFPNGDKITIEMLARHRSGIPHRVMPPEMTMSKRPVRHSSLAFSIRSFEEETKFHQI